MFCQMCNLVMLNDLFMTLFMENYEIFLTYFHKGMSVNHNQFKTHERHKK